MAEQIEQTQLEGVMAPGFFGVDNETGRPKVQDVRRKNGGGWDDWEIPEDVTKYLTHFFGEGVDIKPIGEKPSSVMMGDLGYTIRKGGKIIGQLKLQTNSAGADTMRSDGKVETTHDDWFLYTKKK